MNTSSFSFVRSSLLALTALVPALLTGCVVVSEGGDGTCNYDGETYDAGENFPAGDGCNTCFCDSDGSVGCTLAACDEPPGVCDTPQGPIAAGESYSSDCNTCTCQPSGDVACTAIGCVDTCYYEGEMYHVGESFPDADSCNTCTCMDDGNVACTDTACACDPDTEWYRDYVSLDPAQCEVIDYNCPEHTSAFGNDCGCGCEQSPECEQTYDCQPPNDCPADLAEQCPYSTILH
ncbi:hypothetical protein [Chondromyces apiculatus]|uniref:VWFC domain-containing protein n=1 Tax=Chondromyces apiculatus DSM 436 TaxID=1192034 RepID=A0A017T1Z1_9BACT|nr:hypothetical protein [Chondromyces apiculatus]EYF03289.1 Hypothetical protein CAP_5793 [Chondromyces apiculatus DSM 436]